MNSRPISLRPQRIVRATAVEAGCVRLVQRRHALYRVEFRPEATTIAVRPLTPEATAWLAARGLEGLRIRCPEDQTQTWIERQERAIELSLQNNVVVWRRRGKKQ